MISIPQGVSENIYATYFSVWESDQYHLSPHGSITGIGIPEDDFVSFPE